MNKIIAGIFKQLLFSFFVVSLCLIFFTGNILAAPPAAPSSLTVTFLGNTVRLNWPAVVGVTGYGIFKGLGGPLGPCRISSVNQFTLTYTDNMIGCGGSRVRYGVSAYNNDGESAVTINGSTVDTRGVCTCDDLDFNRNRVIDPYVFERPLPAFKNPPDANADYGVFLSNYDQPSCPNYIFGDLNKDFNVYIDDFSIYASWLFRVGPYCPGYVTPTPTLTLTPLPTNTPTPTRTPTPIPSYASAWFQIQGGDVLAIGSISSEIPDSDISFNSEVTGQQSAGISYYSGSLSTLEGEKGYNAKSIGTPRPETFTGLFSRFDSDKSHTLTSGVLKLSDLPDKGSLGNTVVYYWDNHLELNESGTDFEGNVVIFVDEKNGSPSNLNINTTVTVKSGSFLGFVVSGNISVNAAVTTVEGFYFTDGTFNSGTVSPAADQPITFSGTFMANGEISGKAFNLQRDLGAGNTNPGEIFKYRPDFSFTAPNELRRPFRLWTEAPG